MLSWFSIKRWDYVSSSWFSLSWSLIYSHSFSFSIVFSLFPTSMSFINSSNGPTTCLSARSFASHLCFHCLCHHFSTFSKFFLKVWHLAHRFQHLVYKCMMDCSTALHHQHSVLFIALILLRNIPIAQCLIFNW